MSNDSTVFVGLDVHKGSIVAAYAVGSGHVQSIGNIGVRECDLDRFCKRMQGKASRVVFVYEAGPCGYGLQRYLTRKGFICHVCAPSLMAKKPGDRVKTDRRDAEKLVRLLRMDDLAFVHVPDERDEAFRDLVRAWGAAKEDVKKAKQRLKSFLLVHGVRYSGSADWREAHRRWLSEFTFAEAWSQIAFEEHRRSIGDRIAQSQRLEQVLRDAARQWRFYPVVQALQALRGVQFTVAVGLIAEAGDLSRFDNPRQLMAWMGLVPSEHSSGSSIRKGGITKAGNGYARKLMVEAAWSYRYTAKVSRIIQLRHEGLPKPVVDRAWDAQLRLCRRYRKLSQQGKHPNVVVTAIARELSGFVWDIARIASAV
ncbi:IS110 family transposase [Solimonas marina]|uniref:IS110 family transposase n=1 Tax=Solimonas marina TaxID=2714601 RepID=A0A969WER0_9GAMM|nr:IS110 family transposase [Solimonas marina]NKF24790.1 IS110 family transposase [Solimonas marina]